MKKLGELLKSIEPLHGGEVVAVDDDTAIEGVTGASGSVEPGRVFVAYRGVNVDGHGFIGEAVRRGAAAVVGEVPHRDALDRFGLPPGVPYARVPDGREALAHLSACWHDYPSRSLRVIGVTGTDGKTTTANLVFEILRAAGHDVGLISTVNAVIGGEVYETGLHTTTPDAPDVQRFLAQMVSSGTRYAVLESTSHGLAQHRVTACDFDVAVVTNVTRDHLDIHGSMEAYRAAKSRLFAMLSGGFRKPGVEKVSVLNADDSSYEYLREYPADLKLSYSLHAGRADVTARGIEYLRGGVRFTAFTPAGVFPVRAHLPGAYNVSNVLAAIGVGVSQGVPVDALQQGVEAVEGVPGRMERIEEGQGFAAIVDFAHTPNSLQRALETARGMAGGGRVIAVFGCAGLRDAEKRPMMGRIAARLADYTVITAEDPRTEDPGAIIDEVAAGCEEEGGIQGLTYEKVEDRGAAVARAVGLAQPGDVVLALGKGHEQSMCFGAVEYPWDDREAMRAALRGGSLDTLPTARAKKTGNRAGE